MTPTTVMFMLAIPLVLMGVIGLVLLGGKLRPETRRVIELSLIGLSFPILAAVFVWRALESAADGDQLMAAVHAMIAGGIALQGILLVRKRLRRDKALT